MEDWQERVIEERAELKAKIKSLGAMFGTPTYKKLRRFEKIALSRQFKAMDVYLGILDERISVFEEAPCSE